MTDNFQDSDIAEKVFLNEKYQLVEESEAKFIRVRLKDGRSFTGVITKKHPDAKVVLKMDKDIQHANK